MAEKENGFSLIELLIVVAVILIIAAIVIPNLRRSRMAANEASAVGSVRAINTAAFEFDSIYGDGFPSNLASLSGTGAVSCRNAQLLDSVIGSGVKSGYTFVLGPGTVPATAPAGCDPGWLDGYTVQAIPATVGTTGQRAFCSDATGVIRYNVTGVVTPVAPFCLTTDSPLESPLPSQPAEGIH